MKKIPTPEVARSKASAATKKRAKDVAVDVNAFDDIRDAVSKLKRERIISTAVELFHQNGLSKTTLEAVAEKMNFTKPFIYSHFKSKDELLAEICSRGIRASLDALKRVVATDASSTEKMRALANDFTLAVLENQGHIAIYNREEKQLSADSRDAINHLRREFDRKVIALIDEGVASGEFTVDDAEVAALAIGGIVNWSYVWYVPNGRLSKAEAAEKIAGLVLALVQAKSVKRKRVVAKAA
ncbi:TetR/AcrR family transcriptional regulator [Actimicrobium sp. CCC2.4]|uniref:TetR/AcrR family transcriptional regulator n=1 Tax=Actimicrobium sp. CCC2.4 TaxID=3048606 RepID=UPI002AC99551|nr:TetR/AcrR family transcriptional regulator [Actimicrobium sp. CCC2.4]MEB0134010.1 TetR/AcrR family transcriptional regulator [Actimicrobium sp. CCC2.4]WPX31546.1 TetR/AcrR family transcriptional regulator [Actimicrobium sp. CCC2.4]